MNTIGFQPIIDYFEDGDRHHKVYKFKNGLGVSVVNGPNVIGGDLPNRWAFAVIEWSDDVDVGNYKISRTTPIQTLNYVYSEDIDNLLQVVSCFGQNN